MSRKAWLIPMAAVLGVAALGGVHFWRVGNPPRPASAKLPPSARSLFQPFRKDSLDLTLVSQGEVEYRIAMQAGATLVFAWTASHGPVACQFANQNPIRAGDARGAFVAQSTGWYRWRWSNASSSRVVIHLRMSGYYEPEATLPAGLPYDR